MSLLEGVRRRALRAVSGDDARRGDGRCRLPPEWLVLVVNNFCNLRCRMCDVGVDNAESVFYGHLVGKTPRNMSLELLETVLDQARDLAWKPRVGFAYTEPLIHPRIVDLCRAVVSRGFACTVTTNGFLLPKLAPELVALGVEEITVSVDGPEEVHDDVRGVPGSFARLRDGVAAVRRERERLGRRRPRLSLSFTVTDRNQASLPAFGRAVEDLRPDAVSVSHLNFISAQMAAAHNALHGSDLAVSTSNLVDLRAMDVKALWEGLASLKARARAPGFPPLAIVPDFETPGGLEVFYGEPLRPVTSAGCTDPWRMLLVRTDGSVIPAHGRCYEVPVGNVLEAPLAQLWNAPALTAFRRRLRAAGGALPACGRCCGVLGKPVASGI